MSGAARLLLPLGALLLLAVVSPLLVLRIEPPAPAEARRQARASAIDRVQRLGPHTISADELESAARGPAIEALAAGYPDDDGNAPRGGTTLVLLLSLLLGVLGVAAAAALAAHLDGDLALLASRLEGHGVDRELSAEELIEGLAFDETARLGRALHEGHKGSSEAIPVRLPPENTRRQRSHLLASFSHDLRSPLNSILGFSELLLRGADGPVDDTLRPALQAIRVSGKRQLRLVHQILEVARWQAGRLAIEPRATIVAELLRDAIEDFQRAHELPSEIEVETTLQPGLQPVLVDDVRLAEAIAQLLGEAVASTERAAAKASESGLDPAFVRGRGPIRIEASERRDPDGRHLVITIEAPGGLREGVVTGFSSSFKVLGPGDLGLALPLARALIELHAGTLTVEEGPPPRLVATIPVRAARG